MMHDYAMVFGFLIAGILFVAGMLTVSRFLRPRKGNPVKNSPYECGEEPVGSAWINYNIRFYLLALVFIVFEAEIALMFPVAVRFRRMVEEGSGVPALIEIGIFIAILFVGLIYLGAKGYLNWSREYREEPEPSFSLRNRKVQ